MPDPGPAARPNDRGGIRRMPRARPCRRSRARAPRHLAPCVCQPYPKPVPDPTRAAASAQARAATWRAGTRARTRSAWTPSATSSPASARRAAARSARRTASCSSWARSCRPAGACRPCGRVLQLRRLPWRTAHGCRAPPRLRHAFWGISEANALCPRMPCTLLAAACALATALLQSSHATLSFVRCPAPRQAHLERQASRADIASARGRCAGGRARARWRTCCCCTRSCS